MACDFRKGSNSIYESFYSPSTDPFLFILVLGHAAPPPLPLPTGLSMIYVINLKCSVECTHYIYIVSSDVAENSV